MRSVRSILAHWPTHQSLTDTGGGYNLRGAGLPHNTPRLSQPAVSTFHLRAPPSLQFNPVPSTNQSIEFKELMTVIWSFDHPVIYRSLHLHLTIANDLSLIIGVTRIDRKVVIMQLGYQDNSYNLMHIQEL
jgi:hypothetical protein